LQSFQNKKADSDRARMKASTHSRPGMQTLIKPPAARDKFEFYLYKVEHRMSLRRTPGSLVGDLNRKKAAGAGMSC
jgi:hypothetical protein